jgi:S1-C subfamily serine protease
VTRRDGRFLLEDLKSRNGTFLNGVRVRGETPLADGDVIGFGPQGPTLEFRLLPADGSEGGDLRGAEALARRSSSPREEVAAMGAGASPPRRWSTGVRIAHEVARQTRELRRLTRILLAGLVLAIAAFGGLHWRQGRARARQLAELQARADSLSRGAVALASRFQGELQALRDALTHSQAETARLRDELTLSTGTGGDAASVERLRVELEAAERRQRDLLGAAAVDYRALARRNQDAVAIVLVEFADGERFGGTAFAIDSQGTLVTNRHLLAGEDGTRTPRRIGVMFAGSRQNFPARVVGLAPDADIGVLRVSVAGGVPMVAGLAGDPDPGLERGDPVAMLGYPLGFDLPMARAGADPIAEPTLTVGTVSKVLPDVLQLDAYGAPGSSGSPVLDRAGRVVGVLYGGERDSRGKIVYAVPGHVVARYLATLGISLR